MERWDLLSQLLEDAAERPPEARAAYLDGTCPPELRDEVDALLAADAKADVYFDAIGLALTASTSRIGMQLGPWRLVERIGHGGMGTVYRAERADGAFEQDVALKVLDSVRPDVVARFERERQILARLDHPGVARLLDGGATPEGHPYLVMERVEGEPITDYTTRHQLDMDARLALFIEVCTVVQAAHQQLVVHRDLKPSNVFVTEEGRVKLLDFGIAQLLDGPEDQPRTLTSHRALTPEYAAPEQVRGEAATTATDVYALGVLLYELLAGTRPFDLPRRLAHEAARAVLDEIPDRPSAAATRRGSDSGTDTRTIRRRLEGDLDQICLKALRKEAERRYGTAEALSRDVRRHLEGLPVEARPDTLGYRASRFARRHRRALAVAALAIAGLATLGWMHTTRLQSERDRAEDLTSYVLSLFAAASPWEAESLPTDASFTDAIRLAVGRAESDLSGTDRIRVLEALRTTLWALDDSAHIATAQRLHALALEDFGAESPESARTTATLAWAVQATDPEAADSLFLRALELTAQQHGLASPEMARVESDYGFFLRTRSRPAEAETHLARAVETFRRAGEAERRDLATALEHYATTLADLNRLDEATAAIEESLDMHRELRGDATVPYASALANAASVALNYDKPQAAALNRQALVILDSLLPSDDGLVLTITNNLAVATESPAERQRLYRRILNATEASDERPSLIQNIATAYLDAGDLDSAAVWATSAREAYLKSPQAGTPQASFPYLTLGYTRLRQGRAVEGRAVARTAARELAARLSDDHWVVTYANGLVGWADAQLGDPAGGAERIRRLLDALASYPDRQDQADAIRADALRLGVDLEER